MTTLASWLAERPFGLAMSSGFFSFYAHTGMLSALLARGLIPAHVAGSSAGAMVAGMWAAGLAPEQLAEELQRLRRDDFWDPALGVGLLAGKKFDAILRRLLPRERIEACSVSVRISVFDIMQRRTRVLVRGDLATAIRASCAVPGMFQPVWTELPHGRRPCWDGGILDRAGIAEMPAGRLLFHHIAAPAPWTRGEPPIPNRTDMVTLVLEKLPRPHPWAMDEGRRALAIARQATERALDRDIGRDIDREVGSGVVRQIAS
ncbi:MAG: patatin-like phospholipase family protein [Kofleriaceae bacterium]